jgi:hypothetical protein
MLEVMVIMLGIGLVSTAVIGLDEWAHHGCDGTHCLSCQDVNA